MWLRPAQAGENEGMLQDDDKLLVREREFKEIDNVTNCKGKISWLTECSRYIEDDLALCGAHLALPAFTRRKSWLSRKNLEKSAVCSSTHSC